MTVVRVGAALGLRSGIAPAIVYVPLGYLLGPARLNVLSPAVLGHLDFVLWLALATLGVFAGLGLDVRTRADRHLLSVASMEAAVSPPTRTRSPDAVTAGRVARSRIVCTSLTVVDSCGADRGITVTTAVFSPTFSRGGETALTSGIERILADSPSSAVIAEARFGTDSASTSGPTVPAPKLCVSRS